jgi:menaquinone reductase, molybdopterin-binding-like subunit
VNALESLVDTGRAAVMSFTPRPPFAATPPVPSAQGSFFALNNMAQNLLAGRTAAPKMLLLNDANPVFGAPSAVRVREAFAKIPYIVSFGSFLDETSAMADLILPDNAPLESWVEGVPESGALQSVASLAPPALRPLHNTRGMPDVLLGVAQQLGGDVAKALPWKTFDAMLQAAFAPLRQRSTGAAKSDDEFWNSVQQQGGWWNAPAAASVAASSLAPARAAASAGEPEFDGSAQEFPFFFLPYASQQFRDGSLAHLPWLQELPDVVTTAMWSSWIELNPKTAQRLHIEQGDMVEITSQHGSLRAPAVIFPGIAPDVVAMPAGQGHENFSRYASGRGANAFSILAPVAEPQTGSLAWAATRVKVARAGGSEEGKLTLFAGGMSRFPAESEPR